MSLYLDQGDVVLHQGDVLAELAALPAGSVDCVVTSPPYYGLRDYGVDGQIGLEESPEEFLARLVGVFDEVHRVLAGHGTCWVNIGDSYLSRPRGSDAGWDKSRLNNPARVQKAQAAALGRPAVGRDRAKQLLMIPARLALALQDAGWWLRSDVIWAKPNPMPESATDRPTVAHEHVFLLTKAPRYWYDAEAIREESVGQTAHDLTGPGYHAPGQPAHRGSRTKRRTVRPGVDTNGGGQGSGEMTFPATGRNARNVWTIPTEPNPEAHFATFPRELARRCIEAGCPAEVCAECGEPRRRIVERTHYGSKAGEGDAAVEGFTRNAMGGQAEWDAYHPPRTTGWTDCGHDAYRPGVVLDPFMGSGTTARVARGLGRYAVGIDLNPEYLAIAERLLTRDRARKWAAPGPRPVVDDDQLTLEATS